MVFYGIPDKGEEELLVDKIMVGEHDLEDLEHELQLFVFGLCFIFEEFY